MLSCNFVKDATWIIFHKRTSAIHDKLNLWRLVYLIGLGNVIVRDKVFKAPRKLIMRYNLVFMAVWEESPPIHPQQPLD